MDMTWLLVHSAPNYVLIMALVIGWCGGIAWTSK
jgi:hypothetical protein